MYKQSQPYRRRRNPLKPILFSIIFSLVVTLFAGFMLLALVISLRVWRLSSNLNPAEPVVSASVVAPAPTATYATFFTLPTSTETPVPPPPPTPTVMPTPLPTLVATPLPFPTLDIPNIESLSGQGVTLLQTGQTQTEQGHLSEALIVYQQALAAFAADGDSLGQAYALLRLGSIYHLLNEPLQAVVSYENALPLLGQLQQPHLQGAISCEIARVYLDQGNMQQARANDERALNEFGVDCP